MSEDRLVRALKAIVREFFPDYAFLRTYRYRVQKQVGERFNLQAVRKGYGPPDLQLVEVWGGMAGLSGKLTLGSEVLVAFENGAPTAPRIVQFAPKDGKGHRPIELLLDALTVIQLGSTTPAPAVVAGPIAGAQPVALAPATAAALSALLAFAEAVVIYADAVAVVSPATVPAAGELTIAGTALATALTPLLGSAPVGLSSTNLSAH